MTDYKPPVPSPKLEKILSLIADLDEEEAQLLITDLRKYLHDTE